jgi:hypothetical protein
MKSLPTKTTRYNLILSIQGKINPLLLVLFLSLGILASAYVLVRLFVFPASWFITGDQEQSLLDATMSGLAATFFGLMAGIPTAIWLSGKQQQAAEAKEKAKEEKERNEREKFILSAIRDELQMNRDIIHQMLDDQEKRPTIAPTKGMKDITWHALSDSGELKWVDDVRILLSISEAYFHINALIYLERQYVDISSRQNLVLTPGQEIVVRRVHMIRPDALKYLKDAIKIIDEKIGNQITHDDDTSGLPKVFEP